MRRTLIKLAMAAAAVAAVSFAVVIINQSAQLVELAGRARLDLAAVLSLHPLDVDVEVKLSHARDDGFIALRILKDGNDGGILTIFEWDSVEDHENCMKSQDFASLNEEWDEIIQEDGSSFEVVQVGNELLNTS